MNQAYLPAGYTWHGRPVQVATSIRDTVVVPFLHHVFASGVVAYSGYRSHDATTESDHRCGYALDLVPKAGPTLLGRAQLWAAYLYAKAKRYPYVEWVWTAENKHLHVSFARCESTARK